MKKKKKKNKENENEFNIKKNVLKYIEMEKTFLLLRCLLD